MLKKILTSTDNFCLTLLNLIYSQNCPVCIDRRSELKPAHLCRECSDKLMMYADTPHWVLAEEELAFDAAYHVAPYEDIIKKCVCLFKYDGKRRLSDLLGSIMAEYAAKNLNLASIDIIVPVPLHPVKLRERQFNQSELIAGYLSKKLDKKFEKNWLKRIRYTLPQTGLSRHQRLKNLKDAFLVRKNSDFSNKSVLLIDDVMTTGATLHECARTLKFAGAKKVFAYTLARGN